MTCDGCGSDNASFWYGGAVLCVTCYDHAIETEAGPAVREPTQPLRGER